ncbi:MAG: hypothetical protein AB2693_13050 [Candidatus Thiodiazotropha sp.]
MNDTDQRKQLISPHGTNQVNLAQLHLFGYPLKPVLCIREKLILSKWPNIERILLSLVLKTTT